jgi:hypothetical protein
VGRDASKMGVLAMWQFGNAAVRQTLREALVIGH